MTRLALAQARRIVSLLAELDQAQSPTRAEAAEKEIEELAAKITIASWSRL